MNFIFKKMNKKGFSLIELIVVIAILAIIAAVAIPRFAGIQERSTIKADAATASEIVNAARIEHSDTNARVTAADNVYEAALGAIGTDYMTVPASSQSGNAFTIRYDATNEVYQVQWTPTGGAVETVTENVKWSTTN